jgi:hypothetical protein
MKKTLKNLSVFIPLLIFIGIAQYKEMNSKHEPYPEWYRLSTVLNDSARNGYKNSAFFLGNSATYTAVNPDLINDSPLKYYNFSRGGASSLELMIWLNKQKIYPKRLLPELNSRDLQNNYIADFDIIKTESEDPFDIFKAKLEIEFRHKFETYLPFLMYRNSLIDYAKELKNTRSPIQALKFAFMPESLNSYFRKYYQNGFYEDTKDFSREEIAERKKQYVEYYKGIMREKKNYAESSAETMEKITSDFNRNGSEIIFFRLPKKHELIDLENELSSSYYDKCGKLAKDKEKINYIDLSGKKEYETCLNDGVHWTAKGAKAISSEINSKLKKLQ